MNNKTNRIPNINSLFIDACDAIDAIQNHPRCTPAQYKSLEEAYHTIIEIKAQQDIGVNQYNVSNLVGFDPLYPYYNREASKNEK